MGRIAMASLKVFKKDLEDNISEVMEDLGLGGLCSMSEDELEEKIEAKREKILKKVNKHFDGLKEELFSKSSSNGGNSQHSQQLNEISLSINELRHHLELLRNDVNEIKSRNS